MLKKCHFQRHFLSSSSSSYGKCFTFNSVFAESDYGGYRMATLSGPSFGLNLVILCFLTFLGNCFNIGKIKVVNLDQGQYMDKGITQSSGAR